MNIPSDFKPVPGRQGWYRSSRGDWRKLEVRARELQTQFDLPVQVFCGLLESDDGHCLYLIEDASVADIARVFETGSHNAFPRPQTERVCDELSRVYEIAPFRPYFVDAAGYKATFLQPITQDQAKQVESVLTVGLEGYVSEWSGNGPLMVDTLVKENGLRLWWD
jgi:hypothetical protein